MPCARLATACEGVTMRDDDGSVAPEHEPDWNEVDARALNGAAHVEPAVKRKKRAAKNDVQPEADTSAPADGTNVSRARGLVGDARSEGKPHGAWADYTTRGNGERVVDAHGRDLRHAPGGGWYVWDGRRWAQDPEAKRARSLAMATLTDMQLEAERMPGLEGAELKHVYQSQAPGAYRSALEIASLYEPISTSFEAFDDGPQAQGNARRVNLLNGTYDLERSELGPHTREHLITKLAPVEYVLNADQSHWIDFLRRAQPDEQIRAFLQRLAGYWLTSLVRDEIFPIFWGLGGNGKGTFLDTIRRMLGDYAGVVPDDVLLSQHQKPHPTGLMTFRGLRLAVASETDEGDILAIATLKRLTGGDSIRARFMGKDFVEFAPTHKLVMMTNARPKLRGSVSPSLRRRIFFVPWDTTIAQEDADTGLKERLALPSALSGVLAWALEGHRLWRSVGLAPPPAVRTATDDYLGDEDTLAAFLAERCELAPSNDITADQLYKAYRDYCKEVGEGSLLRPQDFKPALLAKPACLAAHVTHKRDKHGRTYHGLGLRPRDAEDHAQRAMGWGPRSGYA